MDGIRRRGLAAIATLFFVLPASTALAQTTVRGGTPGVDQYVESLPDAEGERVPGVGTKEARRRTPLPRHLRERLGKTKRGALLATLVTSPELGPAGRSPAKPAASRGSSRSKARRRGSRDGDAEVRNPPDVSGAPAVSVVADSLTGGSGLGLLAVLLLIGGSGLAIVLTRRARPDE